MARPSEITDEDIISAGRQREAAGERITAYRLYRAVGGRGRPDRLLAVWTAHVAGRGSAEAQEPPALPPAIRDGLTAAARMIGEQLERTVRQVSADLAAEAAARTAAERDALARERDALARERAALAEEGADALTEFTRRAEDVDRLRGETQRLEEDLRRAEIAREAAETVRQLAVEQLTAAHAARTEALLDGARAAERTVAAERRITELETDLAAVRAGIERQASSGAAGKPIQLAARPNGAGALAPQATRPNTSSGSGQRGQAARRRGRHAGAADVAAPADGITSTVAA